MSDQPIVAVAADNNYVMPMAVTVRSMIDSMRPESQLRLVVLDGGITAENRERLYASWDDPRIEIQWENPDPGLLADVPVYGHVTVSSYFRMLLPEMLDSDRVIYLDSDTLVRRDITDLWNVPIDGHALLAAQDLAAPWINAEVSAKNFEDSLRLFAAVKPVANFEELGIQPESPYFNAGVITINLDLWRKENIVDEVIECCRVHKEHILWWDQYALNAMLADRWKQLDYRWNQGTHIYEYPSWQLSPVDKETFNNLRNDPWIVHFCSPSKPWHDGFKHPFCDEFFTSIDRTVWKGWRPEPNPAQRWENAKASRKRLRNKVRWLVKSARNKVWLTKQAA